MTTKQKIMASIWVPFVSMYILMAFGDYLNYGLERGNLWGHLTNVFSIIKLGAILWIPLLIISLTIENVTIKNVIKNSTILKIFMLEAIICSIPIWIIMVLFPEFLSPFIQLNLAMLLSITARWGYLKWRKIC
jgi:hypothetical protein